MKLNLYVVLDTKSQTYSQPFAAHNDLVAQRLFSDMVNHTNSDMQRHPEDYNLYTFGTYDDQVPELDQGVLTSLGNGRKYVQPTTKE